MTTTNKTYKLPVTLTHHVNFDIDFDKLIDAINKNNFPNCPKLVNTENTYEILSNYFSDYKWGGDTFEVDDGEVLEQFELKTEDSYCILAHQMKSDGEHWLNQCYSESLDVLEELAREEGVIGEEESINW